MVERPKSDGETDVLDAAMRVFWTQGLHVTSYDQLVAATGIGRQCLCQAFGDKRVLFLRSLNHYLERVTGQLLSIQSSAGSPLQIPGRWLTRLRHRLVPQRIGSAVWRYLGCTAREFKCTLDRPVALGELRPDTRSAASATYLLDVAQMVGPGQGRSKATRAD